MEDGCDVDVLDLVVVLVWSSSDLNTSDKNVSKSSCVDVSLDGCEQALQIDGVLDVESSIPLTILVGEGHRGRFVRHGRLESENAGDHGIRLPGFENQSEIFDVGMLVRMMVKSVGTCTHE